MGVSLWRSPQIANRQRWCRRKDPALCNSKCHYFIDRFSGYSVQCTNRDILLELVTLPSLTSNLFGGLASLNPCLSLFTMPGYSVLLVSSWTRGRRRSGQSSKTRSDTSIAPPERATPPPLGLSSTETLYTNIWILGTSWILKIRTGNMLPSAALRLTNHRWMMNQTRRSSTVRPFTAYAKGHSWYFMCQRHLCTTRG